jgi:hypothetical protein
MAITLVVESGAGLASANSYASIAECDAYHEGHLYADYWEATVADTDRRNRALVMATRLINAEWEFWGRQVKATQALQWPRSECPDPDGVAVGDLVATSAVPADIVRATCEMAREILILDRTAAPLGEGEKYHFDGATQIGWDKADRRPVLSALTQQYLSRYGFARLARRGVVTLVRV